MKFLIFLVLLGMLLTAAAAVCEKPDDWNDELDGTFDPVYNENCIEPDDYDVITGRPWCPFGFDCYDEFGTVLGPNTRCKGVYCAQSCDCYGVMPVFTSMDAVQDHKLEVLRAFLEYLHNATRILKYDVATIMNATHADNVVYRPPSDDTWQPAANLLKVD